MDSSVVWTELGVTYLNLQIFLFRQRRRGKPKISFHSRRRQSTARAPHARVNRKEEAQTRTLYLAIV